MRKIPTLYVRDPADSKTVDVERVTPGCEWVIAGEGVATRKYDGTCTMYDGAAWWARREVKPGRAVPDGFQEVQEDKNTGKRVGWEPIGQSSFEKFFKEALAFASTTTGYPVAGTYELCGPKINGNPEHLEAHRLLAHANAETVDEAYILDPTEALKVALVMRDPAVLTMTVHALYGWEGIVWHHLNGSMVKLKGRDLA